MKIEPFDPRTLQPDRGDDPVFRLRRCPLGVALSLRHSWPPEATDLRVALLGTRKDVLEKVCLAFDRREQQGGSYEDCFGAGKSLWVQQFTSATELLAMELPEPKPVVGNLISEGVTLLCGKPKLGKSLWAFNMALSVARGEDAFGSFDVGEGGSVVYVALEDGARRVKSRLKKLLDEDENHAVPERLHFCFEWPRFDEGGLDDVRRMIEMHQPRLVVIDTLAKVRPKAKRGDDKYTTDYESLSGLQALATEHGVAVVVVHHT